jgi:hypothetical protein
VELPLDHFRLLGVSPVAKADQVLRTLEQRLARKPAEGFTADALESRAELLRNSADLLCDSSRREDYERLLTELSAHDDDALPALEVAAQHEVGGLMLLMEAGQAAEAFEGARRALQPPQAPALGSSRELDLSLLAALASRQAADERRRDRRFEAAAQTLQQGIQLLQRMGQQQQQRVALEAELLSLLPFRILDLLSRDLNDSSNRETGQELLQNLVQRRGGLDGDLDPDFPQEAFQSFFQQIRGFLTIQEQIDLFQSWSDAGSVTADFLSAYALTASGFAQRKPERIESALQRLEQLHDVGVEPEMACLHLLLGHTRQAESCFQRGSDPALKEWARQQGEDPLAGLCVYCCDWLERQVLPCYRDLEADPDLEAYFADRDVQAYIERDDRRRNRELTPPAAAITEFELLPTPSEPSSLEELLQQPAAADGDPSTTERAPVGAWTRASGLLKTLQGQAVDCLDQASNGIGLVSERWRVFSNELPDRLRRTSNRQRAVAAGTVLALASLALLGGLGVNNTIASRRDRPPVPSKDELLLPEATEPFDLNTPLAKRAATELAAANSAAETRALLQKWLSAKATLMDGEGNAKALEGLAVPALVENATAARAADAALGRRRRIKASIEKLEMVAAGPERRVARTRLSYGEEVLSDDGELLESDGPRTLENTYFFHKHGAGWQLADFRPTSP